MTEVTVKSSKVISLTFLASKRTELFEMDNVLERSVGFIRITYDPFDGLSIFINLAPLSSETAPINLLPFVPANCTSFPVPDK